MIAPTIMPIIMLRAMPIIMPIIMIAPTTVTLRGYHRRVSILALLLVAIAAPGQEGEAPAIEVSPLRVPDVVITGEDAIIIVPPLPVLPGGSIPVPRVELQPLPFLPSPTWCDPVTAGDAPRGEVFVIEPVCMDLSALSDRLPIFLKPGEPPIPEMHALGVHRSATARDNISAHNNGGDE